MKLLSRASLLALVILCGAFAFNAVSASATVTGGGASTVTITVDATTPATGKPGATFSTTVLFVPISVSCTTMSASGTIDAGNAAVTAPKTGLTFAGCTCTIGGSSSSATVTPSGSWSLQSVGTSTTALNISITQTIVLCSTGCQFTVDTQTINSGLTWANATKSLTASAKVKTSASQQCGIAVTVVATFTGVFTASVNEKVTLS